MPLIIMASVMLVLLGEIELGIILLIVGAMIEGARRK